MKNNVDPENLGDLYAEYVRPRVAKLLKVLKLDLTYVSAQGDQMEYTDGKTTHSVVDLLGGYGSTLLGHNHPELIRAMKQALDENIPVHAQASIRKGAVDLAIQFNKMMHEHGNDPRHFIATLCNSGAEAVEAAIKHALMEWQERRRAVMEKLEREGKCAEVDALAQLNPVMIAIEGSFHGKTAGSISVTTNLELKGMYTVSPIETLFVKRSDTLGEIRQKLTHFKKNEFSAVAGILFEAIQGEGGIQCLTPEFATSLQTIAHEHDAPLLADEIQCGLFRAGSFVAAHALGIKPDYMMFGKSLGGGLSKISALLVTKDRYQGQFGLIHTSTFAEDEISSRVAVKTLEILSKEHKTIQQAGKAFFSTVQTRIQEIQKKYPGVISTVRGQGFLIGVEFNFSPEAALPTVLYTIYQAGFATYIYTSYLLNRHQIRCGVTLSKPDTLRIEPSAYIKSENTERFLNALEELSRLIHERKLIEITRHFWAKEFTPRELVSASYVKYPAIKNHGEITKIGFFTHVIDDTHSKLIDPLFRSIGPEGRKRFVDKLGGIAGPLIYHEQIFEGTNREKIHLHCYGTYLNSDFYIQSHYRGDGLALQQVQAMAARAAKEKMSFVGLGQYTSIVTHNGLLLRRSGLPLTTGNGLTAGYAHEAIVQLLKESGKTLADVRIGVVGAAGNICNVVTQILADDARDLLLVFREGTEDSPKAKEAYQAILKNSKIDSSALQVTDQLSQLTTCDIVVVGTNSPQSVIFPEHLKENAIIMDVSVPTNIDSRVFSERKDVRCYQGGRAKLPLEQSLKSDWLPTPAGETYACMGETIAAGLLGYSQNLSIGTLQKSTVFQTLEMAKKVGIGMGTLKRITRI